MQASKSVLWSVILGLFGSLAWAATAVNPNTLPVTVTSNSATVNLQQGTAVYNGNVQAIQGTRKLQGNTLTIKRGDNGKIQSFLAEGNPAKTQEQPNPTSQVAYGQAQNIYYFPEQGLVKYVDKAQFTQGGNVFSGDVITYNTVTQVVSSPKVAGGSGVTTIILPAYDQGNQGS